MDVDNKWVSLVGDNCNKFMNWMRRSIPIMIIFSMLGCMGGIYISKMLYDIRMDEIAQLAKTGTGGYVHKGRIYDVKLRP